MRLSSRQAKLATALWFAVALAAVPQVTSAQDTPEALLSRASAELNLGPEAAKATLAQLAQIEPTLASALRVKYFTLVLSSYAYRGMPKEEVETGQKALQNVTDPDQRATLLYYLVDGYSRMGEYEKALQAMNDSILLLPTLVTVRAKVGALQSAVSLLESLRAYDDATVFAKRLAALPSNGKAVPTCVGLGDLVEIAFLQHDSARLHQSMPEAIKACDSGGHKIITLDLEAMGAIDRLRTGNDPKVLQDSLALLTELIQVNVHSDYATQLADAIAKRYLAMGQPADAELYGTRAFQWANIGNAILLRQQTSETMAAIMRAQGKLDQALNYLKISHGLWTTLLDDRTHQDLAYQRVKFETQDQANQIKLLGQINQLLTKERDLQDRNQHSLVMLVILTVCLLASVLAWLSRIWQQKNSYRTFAQIDGLTLASNRSHFTTCAVEVFKHTDNSVAVLLFDMDYFKDINDNYGHATGDWVLKTVSATIAAQLRTRDLLGRLGGEEFGICLPACSKDEAMILAERCRSAIAAIDSGACGLHFSVSASFGVAMRPAYGTASFEDTLALADHALYRAKRLGRNRVEAYRETQIKLELLA